MDSKVKPSITIPGITIEQILDEAYCQSGKSELALDKWESPRLDSRAQMYTLKGDGKGKIVIDCDDFRKRYQAHFGITDSHLPLKAEDFDYWKLKYMCLIRKRFEVLDYYRAKVSL